MPGQTFRVKFHSEEDDSYVELWKLVGRAGYIARYTHGPKCWYYVSDPHGYRELDHQIEDDATIIVCGRDGRSCSAPATPTIPSISTRRNRKPTRDGRNMPKRTRRTSPSRTIPHSSSSIGRQGRPSGTSMAGS